jgi:hypothetical protein
MQRTIPWSRWRRRRHALLFGLPLALLELSLFVVSMAYSNRLLPLQAVLLLSVRGGLIGGALAQWTMTAHMQPRQPRT